MCYWRKMLKIRGELADTVWAPIMIAVGILTYAITSPMNYGGLGQLFFYPLYDNYTLQCLYTTGTWLGVYTLIWITALTCNDKLNPTFYKYFTGASLYAYLSHYFFIILIAYLIVRPYKFDFITAFFTMFFGTFVLIFITYWPLNALYECISPPKETVKMDLTPDDEVQDQEAAAAPKNAALEKGDMDEELGNSNLDADKKSDASANKLE